jgi:glycosyltransferase involved in cell wall biosynthesis
MNLAVIIPALNEEQALPLVLSDLREVLDSLSALTHWEIIVADNGSSDRTAAVARAAGVRVVAEPKRGYGAACLAGLRLMTPAIDAVLFIDADFSIYAEDLRPLLAIIESGQADLALGTRRPVEGGALTPAQRFGNALACRLMQLFWRYRYEDLSPIRVIRRESLKGLAMRDPAFGWTVEMQAKALRHHLRIAQLPVRYRRRVGDSKISGTMLGSMRAGWGILSTLARAAYGS